MRQATFSAAILAATLVLDGNIHAACAQGGGETKSGFGHTVQVFEKSAMEHVVRVDGKSLYVDRQDTYVSVVGIYESDGHVYALMAEASGGNACPSMYRSILMGDTRPIATAQFGTCSDLPHVSPANGKLLIAMPAMNGKSNVTFTVNGTQVSTSKAAEKFGAEGPNLGPGADLMAMVAGKSIGDAVRMRAVVQSIRNLVGPVRTKTIIDYAAGGPGTIFEKRGDIVVAMACMAHACNINQAAIAIGHDGEIWVMMRTNNRQTYFGNPSLEIKRALDS